MAKGIHDLGNGLGWIYVTNTSGQILKVYENNAEGYRDVHVDGLKASMFGDNGVAYAAMTIGTPTGAGDITNVKLGSQDIIDIATPISYTAVDTSEDIAQDIVNAINSYSGNIQVDKALRIDSTVYVFQEGVVKKSPLSFSLTHTGNITYVEDQPLVGGADSEESWHDTFGRLFFLDADYGDTNCSGGGIASESSIDNAINITWNVVNIGLNNNIPRAELLLASNALKTGRRGSITFINLVGEGAANYDLESIIINDVSHSDILILYSDSNTITLNENANLNLSTPTVAISAKSYVWLTYKEGEWYEINRSSSVVPSKAEFRGQGFGIFANETQNRITAPAGGTTVFDADVASKYQEITSSSSLVTDLEFNLGTGISGDEFWLEYNASITKNGFNFSIFGVPMSDDMALNGGLIFYARKLGLLWYVTVYPNLNPNTGNVWTPTVSLASGSVTPTELNDSANTQLVVAQISWGANSRGDHKIEVPFNATLEKATIYVDDTIEATDDADVNIKNNAGLSMGTVSLTAGDLIGTGYTLSPTSNNTFTDGQILTLTTTKTTAGGSAKVSLRFKKS